MFDDMEFYETLIAKMFANLAAHRTPPVIRRSAGVGGTETRPPTLPVWTGRTSPEAAPRSTGSGAAAELGRRHPRLPAEHGREMLRLRESRVPRHLGDGHLGPRQQALCLLHADPADLLAQATPQRRPEPALQATSVRRRRLPARRRRRSARGRVARMNRTAAATSWSSIARMSEDCLVTTPGDGSRSVRLEVSATRPGEQALQHPGGLVADPLAWQRHAGERRAGYLAEQVVVVHPEQRHVVRHPQARSAAGFRKSARPGCRGWPARRRAWAGR